MLKELQEAIRKAMGIPSLEECGSFFGRWFNRTMKYGDALVFLMILAGWGFCYAYLHEFMEDANDIEKFLLEIIFVVAVIIIMYDTTALACFFQSPKESEYYLATGVTRKEITNDKGTLGEFYAYVLSRKLSIPHKTLYNVCVPMPNGNYQEIDAIIITNHWIHVLECKNRAGCFTGSFNSAIWVQHIGNEEYRGENIYLQNESHIAALEYFLKAKGVIPDESEYCYNSILTGGEFELDMRDIDRAPANFSFGNYNLLKKQIEKEEKRQRIERDHDFMEKVYMALFPYALFSKGKRNNMLSEREGRARNKEFVRGDYRYYKFPDGIPEITDTDTLLRQDNVFTQISVDDNKSNPVWVSMPHLRYEEVKDGTRRFI